MNTNPFNEPPLSDLADGAKEAALRAGETARQAGAAAREAGAAAQDTYQEAVTRTRAYVQENPLPAMLGAFALGAVLSFVIAGPRREETLRERYVDDPLESIRDTIFAALAPVGKRLHDGYESARDDAEEALDHAHDSASRHAKSWSKQLRSAGHNLKFW